MKKFVIAITILILSLVVLLYSLCEARAVGNLNFFYGQKNLSNKWDNLGYDIGGWIENSDLSKHPGAFGIELDVIDDGMPLAAVIGIRTSYKDYVFNYFYYGISDQYKLNITEVNIGLKKIWEGENNWNFSISGGVDFADARLSIKMHDYDYYYNQVMYEDSGFGGWLGTSIYYTFDNTINIGWDIRYSNISVNFSDLNNGQYNLGGIHYGVIVGYHF